MSAYLQNREEFPAVVEVGGAGVVEEEAKHGVVEFSVHDQRLEHGALTHDKFHHSMN